MPLSTSERYYAHVLHVKGKFLGSIERPAFDALVDATLAAGVTRLVIDVSDTTFMDSSGVGLLIACANRLRELGGDACLAGLQDRVHGLFAITHLLGPVFDDFPTVDAAAQHLGEAAADRPGTATAMAR